MTDPNTVPPTSGGSQADSNNVQPLPWELPPQPITSDPATWFSERTAEAAASKKEQAERQAILDAEPADVKKARLDKERTEAYARSQEYELEKEKIALERDQRKADRADGIGRSSDVPRQLVGRTVGEVAMRAIDWLWTGWIPRKYITLIVGESGAGKSTVLADIVARVTTGKPWPGENWLEASSHRMPGRVLWLGSEDGTADMTKPRLVACGADCDRVVEIQGVSQGSVGQGLNATFSMQDDIESVRKWLEFAQKQGDPFLMLVIDPITSYLPGRRLRKVDMNDTGQLRSILEPWFKVAQEHNLAICSVTHFNKDATRSMLHRVTGSAVFAQTCRSLCAMVAREDDGPFEKAMVQVKVNLPEHPGGAWRFKTEKVTVGADPDNHMPINATRPMWEVLDLDITPTSLMGGERGPLPQNDYHITFPLWLKAHFLDVPADQGLPVTTVMNVALLHKVVSKKWWRDESANFLDKRNVGGTWMCRPK
jgi:hypothetical protein